MTTRGQPAMRLGEFVPLVAMMISLVALSVDAMLPALPAIGDDLRVADRNDVQLVVSTLLLGLAVGQLFYGPLSDSIGRKVPIYTGIALFIAGCLLSIYARTFEMMLVGRLLQGAGAGAPRIVMIAVVRDQFEGRAMARVMSFAMAVFILVPALAPALGQVVLLVAGWRAIFGTLAVLSAIALTWFAIRQPETLPPERRVPLSARRMAGAVREIVTTPVAFGYTLASGCVFSPFVGYLSSAQQIFQQTYGVGEMFPAYFGVLALAIGLASALNGRLVMRHGMRRISVRAAVVLCVLSAAFFVLAAAMDGVPPLALLMSYFLAAFFCIGMLFGNLNSLAMEPLGHIAGIGAAVIGAVSSFIAVPLGMVLGMVYDGTVLWIVGGFALFALAALGAMRWADRGARRAT